MPMYNLLEYNSNYSYMTSSLWFYSKDEATSFNNNIGNKDDFISFEFKDKSQKNTEVNGANGILKDLHNCSATKLYK